MRCKLSLKMFLSYQEDPFPHKAVIFWSTKNAKCILMQHLYILMRHFFYLLQFKIFWPTTSKAPCCRSHSLTNMLSAICEWSTMPQHGWEHIFLFSKLIWFLTYVKSKIPSKCSCTVTKLCGVKLVKHQRWFIFSFLDAPSSSLTKEWVQILSGVQQFTCYYRSAPSLATKTLLSGNPKLGRVLLVIDKPLRSAMSASTALKDATLNSTTIIVIILTRQNKTRFSISISYTSRLWNSPQ